MKIVQIEPFVISQKLSKKFYFSQWEYESRTICLVKITAEDGKYGWGEGYGPANLVKAGIDFFTPHMLGMNVIENETIWQKNYLRSMDYARQGVLLAALSAIDIAVWDLKGKILNLSIAALLGGQKRDHVKPYATGLYFSESSNMAKCLANEALSYKNEGFRAIKMKVGLGLKQDMENINAVREKIGFDIELMADSNHAYNLNEAIQFCQRAESFQLSWFEEPISPGNYTGYSELRKKTNIPIAGGECEALRSGFIHLFKNHCIDIAQPDICAAGGITEVKRISTMAHTFGIEVVPHTWGTGIAISAALQIIGNLDVEPGRLNEPELMLEFDRTESELRDLLVTPIIKAKNGLINIPDLPGLGVDVDMKILKNYLVKTN